MPVFRAVTFYIVVSVVQAMLLQSGAIAQTLSLHDRAAGLLDDGLKDKNPDTRKQAVQALGLAASRDPYFSQVESMLDDKDVQVRLAAITSLVDLKDKRTTGDLQKALNDDVAEVSFAAAKALWSLNNASGRTALVAVLSGETKTSSGLNAVAPGPVETPMTRGFNLGPTLPMGRIGRAEELAWPIAFLCTSAASYLSGAILDVNGGAFVGP